MSEQSDDPAAVRRRAADSCRGCLHGLRSLWTTLSAASCSSWRVMTRCAHVDHAFCCSGVRARDPSNLWSAACAPQPIRAIALASCAHSEGGIPHASGELAPSAAAVPVAEQKDESADRMVQLWPPRNVQDPSNCTALSSYGVAQCKAAVDRERGGWLPLLRELHPPRGVVIISPSAACRESAEMILGKYQPNGDHFQ